ncbi:MAG: hypothetical protein O3B84_05930, partial [Chloroflexi bacterium]|nr:hypothetical protein [Chloroflexota bacterium]
MFPNAPVEPVKDPADLVDWMGIEGPREIDELIRIGSLEPRLVAIIWYALARRRSLIVAAEPRLAGKSTTLGALLALAPPGISFLPVGGSFPTAEVQHMAIDTTYLVTNEVSPGLPGRYLWGQGVADLLQARAAGYGFAATLHAPTSVEALQTFL